MSLSLSLSLPLSLSPFIHCDHFQSKSNHLHIAELAWSAFQWGPRSQWLSSWSALHGPLLRVLVIECNQFCSDFITLILYLFDWNYTYSSSTQNRYMFEHKKKKYQSPHLRIQSKIQKKVTVSESRETLFVIDVCRTYCSNLKW